MTVSELRQKVEALKGQQSKVQRDLREAKIRRSRLVRSVTLTEEAKGIIQKVAKQTQEQLKFHITGLGTQALNSVFGGGWELDLEFSDPEEYKRSVAWLRFLRGPGKKPTNPMDEDSGGACYLASFGLRCANMKMMRPLPRQTLILDEPAGNLNDNSRIMHKQFASMVRKVADSGMQLIIVSTMPELLDVADTVFDCS